MFACVPCALGFESGKEQLEHSKSDYHAYNLRRRVAGDEPLSESQFELRHQLLTETFIKTTKVKTVKRKPVKIDVKVDFTLNRSLFCNQVSENLAENLSFMKKRYGFNFYEPLGIRDIESLLMYLGQVVYNDHRCLWCDKKFADLQAVQTHMSVKGHRRQGHMFEEQIEQYRPYYDAALAKARLLSNTQAAAARSKADQDDDWELVGDDLNIDDETDKTITSSYEILSPRSPCTPPNLSNEAKVTCLEEFSKAQPLPQQGNQMRFKNTQRMMGLAALQLGQSHYFVDRTASKLLLKQHHRLMCTSRLRRQNFNTRMRKKRIFAV